MIHSINIGIHVIAGTVALIIGFLLIFYRKGTANHRRFGNYFLILLLVVVTTGLLGWFFFRSNSFLLMLTFISGYTGYSGYRSVKLKERNSTVWDVTIAFIILSSAILYIVWLHKSNANWSPSVVYPTLFALLLVTVYDIVKHYWLHTSIQTWWLYEHIYKMLSAHSALLSAFCGTLLPDYKPFSQIVPSVFSLWLIGFFIIQQAMVRARIKKEALR